jgi:hypothetical protein
MSKTYKEAMESLKQYNFINNPLRAEIKKQIDLEALYLYRKAVNYKIDKEMTVLCSKLKIDETDDDILIRDQKILNEQKIIFLNLLLSKNKI